MKTHRFKSPTGISSLLIVITLSAWGWLIYQHWRMTARPMSEMWMPPDPAQQWAITDFVIVYIMWSVMMAAMMLPSALPMINAFSNICRQRDGADRPYSAVFSLAYLLVWFVFSLLLTLLQWQLHELQWLSKMMDNNNLQLAAFIFIMAGVYQFTAIKNACLQHCQSPFGFLLNSWRNGYLGAFKMGLRHGGTCVGCCWAQMLIMFAVGVMNIMAMILITLFILMEKGLPRYNAELSRLAGSLVILWGTGLLIYSAYG